MNKGVKSRQAGSISERGTERTVRSHPESWVEETPKESLWVDPQNRCGKRGRRIGVRLDPIKKPRKYPNPGRGQRGLELEGYGRIFSKRAKRRGGWRGTAKQGVPMINRSVTTDNFFSSNRWLTVRT